MEADPDLSPRGRREIEHAARLIIEGGFTIDVVYTSRLKRAIRSTWILLQEMNMVYLPVYKSWRLNERMYGALTGISKVEAAEQLGQELVQEWRGSLNTRPPRLAPSHPYWPGRDRKYADLSLNELPAGESLKDCLVRTESLWRDRIMYDISLGKNVLVVAHGNSLRGVVKLIDGISDDDIRNVAIPTGIPLIYKFNRRLEPIIQDTDSDIVQPSWSGLGKGVFLEKRGLLREALEAEEEWCTRVPGYKEAMRKSETITPYLRQLKRLSAVRELQAITKATHENQSDAASLDVGQEDAASASTLLSSASWIARENLTNAYAVEEQRIVEKSEEKKKKKPSASAIRGTPYKTTLSSRSLYASKLLPLKRGDNREGSPTIAAGSTLVIIRHGKTEFNKLGLFTGWDDAPLAEEGRSEAKAAGKLLKLHGYEFDVVYTSWLSRAIETSWLVLDELDSLWLPIVKSWRLNERMYGALTGLCKKMVAQRHGKEKFMAWRRSYATRPPPVSSFDPFYPGNDGRYNELKDLPVSLRETFLRFVESGKFRKHRRLPKTESLQDCMERTIPYFRDLILPSTVNKGKRVLVSSSENAIRGLMMYLCNIPPDRISEVEIPTGLPLIYDVENQCIKLLDDGTGRDLSEVYDFGKGGDLLFGNQDSITVPLSDSAARAPPAARAPVEDYLADL